MIEVCYCQHVEAITYIIIRELSTNSKGILVQFDEALKQVILHALQLGHKKENNLLCAICVFKMWKSIAGLVEI